MTSDTNIATETLRTLHRVHRQLDDLNGRLTRGPRVIGAHEANVQRADQELADAGAEHLAVKTATDEKQLQLSTSEANIQRRQLQLQSASSNTEYQALKEEIAATKAANEVLEVEILEAMEKLDTLAERVAHCKAEQAKAVEELGKTRQKVEKEKPLIQGDLQRLRSELAEAEAALPSDFREQYNRVVRARGEDALAPVENEYCGGCNQHVPVNNINELMLGRPASCRACGRLLYLPEEGSPV
jgi:predicted  nucleic acid-binding Zn-ribbon protein